MNAHFTDQELRDSDSWPYSELGMQKQELICLQDPSLALSTENTVSEEFSYVTPSQKWLGFKMILYFTDNGCF